MTIALAARAKINLALHVTGRRADGYHTLDSIVAFTDIADTVTVRDAPTLSLTITGPFAWGLSDQSNLCLIAARALSPTKGAHITLHKSLPVASGIGGGSADAAATLRALCDLWSLPLPPPEVVLALGADVPACLLGRSARMQGIGQVLTPVALPEAHIVLVNPGEPVPTAQVYHDLDTRGDLRARDTSPLPDRLPGCADVQDLARFLADLRNDLEYPAALICPEISEVLFDLAQRKGCLLARMSGSGGTCFGLFQDEDSAFWAARMLGHAHKDWWVQAGRLLA